jgi:hypothetical protein
MRLDVDAPHTWVSLAEGGRRRFGEMVALLPDLLDVLRSCAPMGADYEPLPNVAGVYLFSDGDEALYVGQTRKLRQRMRNHRSASSDHNQASFAFLLAREVAGAEHPDIDLRLSRKLLAADPRFAEVFADARKRVGTMSLRFVEVDSGTLVIGDPTYLPGNKEPTVDAETALAPDAFAAPVLQDTALLIGRFGGDGTYPVIGEVDEAGVLARVTVEFVDPWAESDGDDHP